MTTDVQMGCAEIDFDMAVDMGASQLLPRLIGADRTMDPLLSGRRISGVEPAVWELATRVTDDPLGDALDLARGIAIRNRHAIVEAKRLVRSSDNATVADGMREELAAMANNIGSSRPGSAVHRHTDCADHNRK